MANQVYANNASAVLASGITDSATTITVATGQGASFPTVSGGNWAYITLVDTSGNVEIVKCTAHSAAADTFTCTRGQDGTTARAFSANDLFELRVTKATLDTLRDVANQTSGTLDGVIIGGGTPAAITGTTITANTGFSGALNGTVGATTPATGAFTTLSTTGNVTLGDASGDSVTINAATAAIPNGLNFDSNTLVIDATNNRVGFGTGSPSCTVEAIAPSGTSTAIARFKTGTGAGNRGFGITSDASGNIAIQAIRSSDNTTGYALYCQPTGGVFAVGVSSTTSNGGVIETKDGITFPASFVGCANANTLDDYEEGTWTPTLTGATSGTQAGQASECRYTKTGRQVFVEVDFRATITAATLVGGLKMTGFPFAPGEIQFVPTMHIRGATATGTAGAPWGILGPTGLALHAAASMGSTAYLNETDTPTYLGSDILQNGITTVYIRLGLTYNI